MAFPSRQTHTRLDIYVVSINSVQYQHYIMLKRMQWSSPVLLKWRKLRRAGGAWWGAGVWSCVCVSTCSVGGQVLSASHQGPDHKPGQTLWKEKRKWKLKTRYLFLPTRNVSSNDNKYLYLLIIVIFIGYYKSSAWHMVQVGRSRVLHGVSSLYSPPQGRQSTRTAVHCPLPLPAHLCLYNPHT